MKKWYSIDILQLPNISVKNRYIYLKVTGKFFDLLKPKSYLSRLEDIARHAT